MKLALACLTHNRPDFAKVSVESILKARRPKRMKTFVQIDSPDETKSELINIYKQLKGATFIFSDIGTPNSALLLLRRVFRENYDLCFYIEDDIIVSEDFFEFCLDVFKQNSSKVVAVCGVAFFGRDDDRLYSLHSHYSAHGTCIRRDFFIKYVDPVVDEFLKIKTPEEHREFIERHRLCKSLPVGFSQDILILAIIQREELLVATPLTSRSKHIGTNGHHTRGPSLQKSLEEWAATADASFFSLTEVAASYFHSMKLKKERQAVTRAKCVLIDPPPANVDGLTYFTLQRYKEIDNQEFLAALTNVRGNVHLFEGYRKRTIEKPDIYYVFIPVEALHDTETSGTPILELIAETPHTIERTHNYLKKVSAKYRCCITPSSFFSEVLSNYFKDVRYVPVSINLEALESGEEPIHGLDLGNRFVFLCISTMQRRKNIPELIECFEKAFEGRDDVCLVLKIGLGGLPDLKALLNWKKSLLPLIFFSTKTLNRKQLNWLYRKAHAYVTATRGEGLNIPLLEAMYVGLPVIAPLHTAHLDYLTEENSFPVRSHGMSLLEDNNSCYITHIGYEFPIVDLDDMIAKMRYVVDNYNKAKAKTSLARETVLKKFSVEVTREQLLNVLREYS